MAQSAMVATLVTGLVDQYIQVSLESMVDPWG